MLELANAISDLLLFNDLPASVTKSLTLSDFLESPSVPIQTRRSQCQIGEVPKYSQRINNLSQV